jgi:hypothetical protein
LNSLAYCKIGVAQLQKPLLRPTRARVSTRLCERNSVCKSGWASTRCRQKDVSLVSDRDRSIASNGVPAEDVWCLTEVRYSIEPQNSILGEKYFLWQSEFTILFYITKNTDRTPLSTAAIVHPEFLWPNWPLAGQAGLEQNSACTFISSSWLRSLSRVFKNARPFSTRCRLTTTVSNLLRNTYGKLKRRPC